MHLENIKIKLVLESLKQMRIDTEGLDDMDRKYLRCILNDYNDLGCLGLAACDVSEDETLRQPDTLRLSHGVSGPRRGTWGGGSTSHVSHRSRFTPLGAFVS